MIILTVAGSLPGYWTSIILIDTIGRKALQILGFFILTIIFSVLGFCYYRLDKGSLLALYVIANYFFNFGPNTTTFIIPGECYPTRYRSTGHGISAAMGKVGAIVAQVISIPILHKDAPPNCLGTECTPWIDRLMQIFALFMLFGLLVSFLVPETKGYTLEELAGERPTSYNSGRNGSIIEKPKKWWNPLSSGKPAGFIYSRSRRRVVASPELAAQNAHSRKRHFWRGRSRAERQQGGRADSTSSTANITTATPNAVPPGWGAGWGRIDRGGQSVGLENIKLQDVGQLLVE
jgi:MFS transporter, PHS family, inorganic phosphate transporter